MSRRTETGEANGATLCYEIAGSGDPLVLVHTGMADGRMWGPQMEAFSAHYRTVRYDTRGFGGSPMVEDLYSHHADLLERELSNARKAAMPGTAHPPNMQSPEQFNNLVLDFLRN